MHTKRVGIQGNPESGNYPALSVGDTYQLKYLPMKKPQRRWEELEHKRTELAQERTKTP